MAKYGVHGHELSIEKSLQLLELGEDVIQSIDIQKSISIELQSNRSSSNLVEIDEIENYDVVSIDYEDGGNWVFTQEQYQQYIAGKISGNRSDGIQILNHNLQSSKRGGSVVAKIVSFIVMNKTVSKGVKWLVERVENLIVNKTGMHYIDADKSDFIGSAFEAEKSNSGKYLLLIHGTNSSIDGSFCRLIKSAEWKTIRAIYGENIIGLEHRTMSQSVMENTLEIYNSLPDIFSIDILCFSRGALIAECLNVLTEKTTTNPEIDHRYPTVKYLLDYTKEQLGNDPSIPDDPFKKTIQIGKITRVAGAAAGTSLLGDNIPDFLQTVFNLSENFKTVKYSKVYNVVKVLLLFIVKQKDNPISMPGIKNMVPDDELLRIINSSEVFSTPIYSIQGIASADDIPESIKTILADWVFEQANDLVVDTVSMNQGLLRSSFHFKLYNKLPKLDHFKYFKNDTSRARITEAICEKDQVLLRSLFTELSLDEQTRGTYITQGGEVNNEDVDHSSLGDKELIVLLPGILGSTLSINDEVIWVNMLRLAKISGLSKLDLGNPNVIPTGGMGNAYKCFKEKFKENYDILIFPFDWRKDVQKEGVRFVDYIRDLEKVVPTIHILAHSMGGLIARELMIRDKELQLTLASRSGKIMLLGTPWLGSYLILETFNSTGKRFKQLHKLTKFGAWSNKALLEKIYHYQGLWNLLPLYGEELGDKEIWENFHTAHPRKALDPNSETFQLYLANFRKYKQRIKKAEMEANYSNVYYIAGFDHQTTNGFVVHDDSVSFRPNFEGDGSVTWASGIPNKLRDENLYYVDEVHGELCNAPNLYDGIHDILASSRTNNTYFFKSKAAFQDKKRSRGLPHIQQHVLSNRPEDIIKDLMGLAVQSPYQEKKSSGKLQLEIINGDLKYAKYPLMLGHFYRDDIMSTESVVDFLYDNELTNRNNLGAYPSFLGTSLLVQNKKSFLKGALVVGLGTKSKINPQRLQYAVEQAVLEFLLNKNIEDKSGLSSIIIGSGFGDMILTECVNAIINGIVNANDRLSEIYPEAETVRYLDLIELYKDKAEGIYEYIHDNKAIYENMGVFLQKDLETVQGYVEHRNYNVDKRWWYQIEAKSLTEAGELTEVFQYSVSSKIARVQNIDHPVDLDEISLLLGTIDSETNWNRDTIQTAFRMMIPKDIIRTLCSNNGIVWLVDKFTAAYPWELIFFENLQDKPTSILSGMIRQLAIKNTKPVKYVNQMKVCIIADPQLNQEYQEDHPEYDKLLQLPGAEKEGKYVAEQFEKHGYKPTSLIGQTYAEIYPKLILEKQKILHIACHGVIDWGPKKKTGLVFDYQSILNSAKLSNLEFMPDFVFLNCCYSGHIKNSIKNEFAANVGITLIENGVKAVIVGAWKIDDSMAMEFSTKFYELFLKGAYFGDAVRAAREHIYEQNPKDNTWAAYQCYGNQYYSFKTRSTAYDFNKKTNYKLEKDIFQDLERMYNFSFSARYRSKDRLKKLLNIKETIEKDNIRNEKIIEKLARLFAENGDYQNSIQLYDHMKGIGKLKYSLWSKSFSQVIRAKHFVQLCQQIPNTGDEGLTKENFKLKEGYLKSISSILSQMKENYDQSPVKDTIVAYCSVLKSYLIVYECFHSMNYPVNKNQEKDFKDKLKKIADLYLEAFLLVKKESGKIDSHLLCASIYSYSTFKGTEAIKNIINKHLDDPVDSYLNHLLDSFKHERKKRFWDEIKEINVYEAQLVLFSGKDAKVVPQIVQNTISDYSDFWESGGSVRNLMAEIDQINFLLTANKITHKYNKTKVRALVNLLSFYTKLLNDVS